MRLTPAHLVALALLPALLSPLAACYASHELSGPTPTHPGPDAGYYRDGSTGVDLGAPPSDADLGAPPADASTCTHVDSHVDVRIETIEGSPVDCMRTHVDSLTITGVDPEPAVDGIRLHASYTGPDPVVTRCDIVVSHVGTDLAGRVTYGPGLTMDVRTGYLSYVSIRHAALCDCASCPCAFDLSFYAADADPDHAEHVPSELAFSNGSPVCGDRSSCTGGSWHLHARASATESDVPEGTDAHFGPMVVRAVRDVDVFAPCAACATCGTVSGSWVAWLGPFAR